MLNVKKEKRANIEPIEYVSWVELFLLLLLVLNLVFLIVEVSSPKGQAAVWGARWTDYGLFVIFVLYT